MFRWLFWSKHSIHDQYFFSSWCFFCANGFALKSQKHQLHPEGKSQPLAGFCVRTLAWPPSQLTNSPECRTTVRTHGKAQHRAQSRRSERGCENWRFEQSCMGDTLSEQAENRMCSTQRFYRLCFFFCPEIGSGLWTSDTHSSLPIPPNSSCSKPLKRETILSISGNIIRWTSTCEINHL